MKRKNKKSFQKVWERIVHQTTFRQWALGIFITLALLAIMIFASLPLGVTVEVGQVAKKDLAAPLTAVNTVETELHKEEAARKVLLGANEDLSYHLINPTVILKVEENLTGILNLLRLSIPPEQEIDVDTDLEIDLESEPEPEPSSILSISEVDRRLIRDWKIEIPDHVLQAVAQLTLAEFDHFAQVISDLLLATMEERISEDGLRDARDDFEAEVQKVKLAPDLSQGATIIGRQLIQPNLVLDTEKVNLARDQAIASVEPTYIMQGEIIVRKGDVVKSEHISLLRDVGLIKTGRDYGAMVGIAFLVVTLVILTGTFLYQNRQKVLENETLLGLAGSVLLAMVLLAKVFSLSTWMGAAYLNPSALAGLLLTLLIDSRVATIVTIVLAVLVSIIYEFSWVIGTLTLVSGLTAIFSVSKVSQRGDLMRAGLIVGGTNFFFMITLGLISKDTNLIIHSYLGLLNGFLVSIVAIGVLPYLESLFKITSPIRLLELSNPNHPLLRRLMMEAPGTYHHSILVGNLAEAAAEAIGADGLLARVGSHYHDIGKLKRPYLFVENQVGMENPHDKMAPTLSTLIIISHVKDGLELAAEFKLPPVVTQFIAQHHGTDLVRYFYHRASEDGSSVEERDFRYPGPKPQGKEVAIVSLADATEAAVRSLAKPTPGKIEALVRKIIKDRLNSGELDESDLTFQDLDKIINSFVKVVLGIYHTRVEYPEQITKEEIEGKRNKNGSADQ